MTYKEGDEIMVFSRYRIQRIELISGDSYLALVNVETDQPASAPINAADPQAITEEEMKQTHGIKQFNFTRVEGFSEATMLGCRFVTPYGSKY